MLFLLIKINVLVKVHMILIVMNKLRLVIWNVLYVKVDIIFKMVNVFNLIKIKLVLVVLLQILKIKVYVKYVLLDII